MWPHFFPLRSRKGLRTASSNPADRLGRSFFCGNESFIGKNQLKLTGTRCDALPKDTWKKWAYEQMDKWTNGQMDKWTNGQMDKWKNGKMDKWTNGLMD
jgi:hypothetical protein